MTRLVRIGVVVFVAACWGGARTFVAAQAPARGPAPGEVKSDPIKCWWGTDKNAVHVGEQFTLTLSCGVIETSQITVVVSQNQFEPTAVQIAPFQVISGTRYEDIQAPPWRYVQHQYALRLISERAFGQDVDIPSIKVTYNIRTASSGTEQGKDLTYVLPSLPIRIVSLVPRRAADIRDSSRDTFADIEAQRFRATGELVAAVVFFGFSVVLLGLAGVRVAGRFRTRVPAAARPLPSSTVLRGCLHGLDRLKSDVSHNGWTPELAGRALTVLRIAGAVALDRPVAQPVVDRHVPGREGQLPLRKGIWRPKRALVSASVTAEVIDSQLAGSNGKGLGPRRQAILEEIRNSLRVFGTARYSPNSHLDRAALDTALDKGASAVQRLRMTKLWPRRSPGLPVRAAEGL